MLDAFRNEIVEAEKSRTELLKWKLLLVSAIGSVALGFGETSNPAISPPILLCFIPLICVFVDILCRHLQLRILAISDFYSRYQYDLPDPSTSSNSGNSPVSDQNEMIDCFSDYEKFCHEIRREKKLGIFDLEDWAMEWSTSLSSFLLIVVGPFISENNIETSIFILSGTLGIALSFLLDKKYRKKRKGLSITADNFFNKKNK